MTLVQSYQLGFRNMKILIRKKFTTLPSEWPRHVGMYALRSEASGNTTGAVSYQWNNKGEHHIISLWHRKPLRQTTVIRGKGY